MFLMSMGSVYVASESLGISLRLICRIGFTGRGLRSQDILTGILRQAVLPQFEVEMRARRDFSGGSTHGGGVAGVNAVSDTLEQPLIRLVDGYGSVGVLHGHGVSTLGRPRWVAGRV